MTTFSLAEARALLPEVRAQAQQLVVVRADLAEARAAQQQGHGSLPQVKALEARLHELVEWYPQQGIQLKGLAPLTLDFPSRLGEEPVLLCWLEGETSIDWYHREDLGFLGRRPLDDASFGA